VGLNVQFGLYHTDFSTFEKTARPIAELFKKIGRDEMAL
jgi:hypothetical protein